MGWLEKIFGGSTHRISGGQYHGGYEGGQYHGGYEGGQYHSGHEGGQYQGGYEDNTIWEGPTASVVISVRLLICLTFFLHLFQVVLFIIASWCRRN